MDSQIVKAWADFQAVSHFKVPESDAENLELIEAMNYLLDHYNCGEEPYASLLHLLGTYIHQWEEEHEPIPDATPAQMLEFFMDQHGLSQNDLAREGIASQTLLSKILNGKREISKDLAKRLAGRFHTNVEVFL